MTRVACYRGLCYDITLCGESIVTETFVHPWEDGVIHYNANPIKHNIASGSYSMYDTIRWQYLLKGSDGPAA